MERREQQRPLDVAKQFRRKEASIDKPISISESPLRRKETPSRLTVKSSLAVSNQGRVSSAIWPIQPNLPSEPTGKNLNEAEPSQIDVASRCISEGSVHHSQLADCGMALYATSSRSLPHISKPPILPSLGFANIPADRDMQAVLAQLNAFKAS